VTFYPPGYAAQRRGAGKCLGKFRFEDEKNWAVNPPKNQKRSVARPGILAATAPAREKGVG